MIAALVLAAALAAPTPSPTLSPLPSATINYYADRGAAASGLDVALVRAVIDAESADDPHAVSPAGAAGLMQLEPSTASDCGIADRFDALSNAVCGSRTLRYLITDYGLERGIAAYNWGAGNISAHPSPSAWPVETRQYVSAVIARYDALQHVALVAEAPTPSPSPTPEALPAGVYISHDPDAWGAQMGCTMAAERRYGPEAFGTLGRARDGGFVCVEVSPFASPAPSPTPPTIARVTAAENPCRGRILCGPIRLLPRDPAERRLWWLRFGAEIADAAISSAAERDYAAPIIACVPGAPVCGRMDRPCCASQYEATPFYRAFAGRNGAISFGGYLFGFSLYDFAESAADKQLARIGVATPDPIAIGVLAHLDGAASWSPIAARWRSENARMRASMATCLRTVAAADPVPPGCEWAAHK